MNKLGSALLILVLIATNSCFNKVNTIKTEEETLTQELEQLLNENIDEFYVVFEENYELIDNSAKLNLLKKMISVDKESAYMLLGYFYLKNKEFEKSLQCFDSAIISGSGIAACFLGDLYSRGENSVLPNLEVEIDTLKSLQYYRLGVNLNNQLCQYRLAMYYFKHRNIPNNIDSVKHFLKLGILNTTPVDENTGGEDGLSMWNIFFPDEPFY